MATVAENFYRTLIARMRDAYGNAYIAPDDDQEEAWATFHRATLDVYQWADVIGAARMRWRATKAKLVVPELRDRLWRPSDGLSIAKLVQANPWLHRHAVTMSPIVQEQARITAEVERTYKREWTKATSKPTVAATVPAHRLVMAYRMTVSQIADTAEQVELAQPEIGMHFPFAEYFSRGDKRVRRTHAQMHGTVCFKRGEGLAVLRRCMTPAGYNCRCGWTHRTWADAYSRGWATAPHHARFEVKWSNSGAKRNYESGAFPDKDFQYDKFVAGIPDDSMVAAE